MLENQMGQEVAQELGKEVSQGRDWADIGIKVGIGAGLIGIGAGLGYWCGVRKAKAVVATCNVEMGKARQAVAKAKADLAVEVAARKVAEESAKKSAEEVTSIRGEFEEVKGGYMSLVQTVADMQAAVQASAEPKAEPAPATQEAPVEPKSGGSISGNPRSSEG